MNTTRSSRAKYLIILSVSIFLSFGCAVKAVPTKVVKVSTVSGCKVVGKSIGDYSVVLVRRGCLKPGVTEVIVALHALGNSLLTRDEQLLTGKLGVEEATKSVIKILGYKPSLSAVSISKVKGVPCYIFIVVE